MATVLKILRALLSIINPWRNDTGPQRAGSLGVYLAIAAIVLTAAIEIIPLIAPDVADVPADVVEPAPDAIEDDGPPPGAILGAILTAPLGCSGAQKRAWKDAGAVLGNCLWDCGVPQAAAHITEWANGVSLDAKAVGQAALPCVIGCATRAGGVLIARLQAPGDSVGATSTLATRTAALLATPADPLEAACGPRDGEPDCVIVLRY